MKHFSGWCFPHHTSAKILLLKLLTMQLPELKTSALVFETQVLSFYHLLTQQGIGVRDGSHGTAECRELYFEGKFSWPSFPIQLNIDGKTFHKVKTI